MKLLISSSLILGLSHVKYLSAIDLSDLENLELPEGFGDVVDPQVTDDGKNIENSDPCADITCQNDAECENKITYVFDEDSDTNVPTVEAVCNCKDGFGGTLCEIDINECERAFDISNGGTECSGKGTCHNNVNGYYCDCVNGYSGDDCEIDNFCTSNVGGSPCQYDNACVNGACICNGIYVIEDANQKKTNGTIQYDEADTHPNNALGFYTDGEFCEQRDYCSVIAEYYENDPDNFQPSCGEMSVNTCVNKDTNNGWVCSCTETYLGHFCQYTTADVCPEDYCGDHGNCNYDLEDEDIQLILADRGGTLLGECYCDFGYFGDRCQNRDECAFQTCNDRGQCSNIDSNPNYVCNCDDGYDGYDCEFEGCDPDSPTLYKCDETFSDTSSCSINSDLQGICPCLEAPDRTDCDVWGPVCHSSVTICHPDNTESCDYDIADPNTAICTCKAGFLGYDCSLTDGCAHNNPCSNRGSCVDENDAHETGYTCTCDLGYAGVDCEYHVCDEGVAENLCDPQYSDLSSCTVDADTNTGVCQCLEAPERTDCDLWGPVCHSSVAETCFALGTESCDYNPDDPAEPICNCKTGYSGNHCTQFLADDLPEPPSCSAYTRGKSIVRNISTKYLTEVSDMLESNVGDLGSCYNLIKNGIYGQVEHPDIDRDDLDDYFSLLEDEAQTLVRMNYAGFVGDAFANAFYQARAGSAIFEIFCINLGSFHPVINQEAKNAVVDVCKQHAWRFRGMLHAGTTDFCDFGSYPLQYKPYLKANELDPENCE